MNTIIRWDRGIGCVMINKKKGTKLSFGFKLCESIKSSDLKGRSLCENCDIVSSSSEILKLVPL